MRVSHGAMTFTSLRRTNDRLSAFERSQSSLASGKRLTAASDDPAGMNRALDLRDSLAAREQEARNAADAASWIRLGDSKLQSVVDLLQRARELGVRGSSTSEQAEREALAVEIRSIRETVLSLSNSTSQGRRLFGGFTAGEAVGQVAGVWTYTGDTGQVTRRVGDTDVVVVNVTADEVFGFSTGRDVFSVLDDVEASLMAGGGSATGALLNDVDQVMSGVLAGLSKLGAAANRVESAQTRNQADVITLKTELSETEDIDLAKAITELQLQEVAYKATLGALSRSLQPSLVDFLR